MCVKSFAHMPLGISDRNSIRKGNKAFASGPLFFRDAVGPFFESIALIFCIVLLKSLLYDPL